MTDIITVLAGGNTALKRIAATQEFKCFALETLEACAIGFQLRGNALEGFEFEIKDSVIRDLSEVISELIAEAAKL